MAISDDTHNNGRDGNLERDPHLARLMEAAGGEAPPEALDAAILAAARREVGARPLAAPDSASPQVAGAGESASPVPRQKRNWFVPVSIAAVLVMSASLVMLVHDEKGADLTQPPRSVPAPAAAPAPQELKETAKETAASANPEAAVRAAEPAKLKAEAAKRAETPPPAAVAESADSYAMKQRKQAVDADRTIATAKSASSSEVPRRDTQAGGPADRAASAPAPVTVLAEGASRPGSAFGGAAAGAAAPPTAPPASARESRPEPFPAAREQASAQAQRDAAASARQRADITTARERADITPARERAEADRNVAREVMRDAPAPLAPPAATRAAPAVDDGLTRAAPPLAEGRVAAPPPPPPPPTPAAKSATAPSPQRSSPQQTPRAAWLTELDNQPPEKWLERRAQFKRDSRPADVDELMAEFRRRFPDHPASAR